MSVASDIQHRPLRRLVAVMGALLVAGVVCGWLYRTSPGRVIDLAAFQQQLERKELTASRTLLDLRERMRTAPADSLVSYPFADDDISYYIIEDGELTFWSDNRLDISAVDVHRFRDWHFVELPNAYCVILASEYDGVTYVALLVVKHHYPYENDLLVNRFARGFDMDKRVGVVQGDAQDTYAVHCGQGHYLFSLVEPAEPVYNEWWSRLSGTAYALCLVLALVAYARLPRWWGGRGLSVRSFLLVLAGGGSVVAVLLGFSVPDTLLGNSLFSPILYSGRRMLANPAHLSVLTAFIVAASWLFFRHVHTGRLSPAGAVAVQLAYPACFLLLCAGLRNVVLHSSIRPSLLDADNFSWAGLWVLLLAGLWGMALAWVFFGTHRGPASQGRWSRAGATDGAAAMALAAGAWLAGNDGWWLWALGYVCLTAGFYAACRWRKSRQGWPVLLLGTVLYAAFVTGNFRELGTGKDLAKYRVLAQNVSVNGNVENDRMADLLLEELDGRMAADPQVARLVAQPDSTDALKDYLDERYFRGFWNNYDVQPVAATASSDLLGEYREYIGLTGVRIGRTHFYRVPSMQNAMTHVGVFQGGQAGADTVYCFLEFYPRRQYRSYSFPDLLIPASADLHKQMGVSVAKYDGHRLTYASGTADYPADDAWTDALPPEGDHAAAVHAGHLHYVYRPGDGTCIVVSRQKRDSLAAHLRFWVYLSLVYFALAWLTVRAERYASGAERFRPGLAARFQYLFIALLVLCFTGVFYFSVDFIRRRYHKEQIENLRNKRGYIQQALQNLYYWNQSLDAGNTSALNADLQELSYTYQTDIHVYDNRGVLVGSSQPLLFYRHLVSNRMASRPYFSARPDLEQYEHIGNLDYLAAYTDFYNGDYLQIGYIAVPQFLSEENMQAEIKNFSTVIVHIYLGIALLAILLTIVAGRRISAPLHTLERKLREMRIGRRNEKIDYRYHDEIGQLVAQYNRMVDELEQSVRLLAQSERESAWKSMARQVAHEINNPLTPMKLSIQQLQRRKDMADAGFDDYFRHTTAMLVEQIDNLSRIAATFSDFARMPEARPARVDVADTLQQAVRLFANNREQVDVRYAGTEQPVYVIADAKQLVQVFNNLIKNAIQSIPRDRRGQVTVSLAREGGRVLVAVTDNGSGVPPDARDKLFTPNFTTKAQGMGLGLAISKKIVEQFGGTIAYDTQVGEGSTFRVALPPDVSR